MRLRGYLFLCWAMFLTLYAGAFPFNVETLNDSDPKNLLEQFTLDDDKVIAIVNDQEVPFSEIKFRFLNRLLNYRNLNQSLTLTLEKIREIWRIEFDQLMLKYMMQQFLAQEQLLPPMEDVKKAQQQYRENTKLYNDAQYEEHLRFHGMTPEKALLEHQLQLGINAWLMKLHEETAKPSEEECLAYYADQEDRFKGEDTVSYYEITLDSHDKPDVKAEHRELLLDIRKKIIDGVKPFSFYAKNFSDAEVSRKNNGLIEDESVSKIKRELPFLLELNEGDMSPIVQLGTDRLGIYKLEKFNPGTIKPYDEVRQKIYDYLLKSRVIAAKEKVIKHLKDQAVISEVS